MDSIQDIYTLSQLVSVGLLFILIKTGAWRNSISTLLNVVNFTVLVNLIWYGMLEVALLLTMVLLLLLTIKSILVRQEDKIFSIGRDIFKLRKDHV